MAVMWWPEDDWRESVLSFLYRGSMNWGQLSRIIGTFTSWAVLLTLPFSTLWHYHTKITVMPEKHNFSYKSGLKLRGHPLLQMSPKLCHWVRPAPYLYSKPFLQLQVGNYKLGPSLILSDNLVLSCLGLRHLTPCQAFLSVFTVFNQVVNMNMLSFRALNCQLKHTCIHSLSKAKGFHAIKVRHPHHKSTWLSELVYHSFLVSRLIKFISPARPASSTQGIPGQLGLQSLKSHTKSY